MRTQEYQPLNGCLEYGNVGETTKAKFEGDKIESEKAIEENRIGCTAARDTYHSVALKADPLKEITPLAIPVKVLFPSDIAKPSETMLVLSGEVKLSAVERGTYSISFNVEVMPYDGAKDADASKIFVQPIFDERVASLQTIFKEYIGESLPIEKLSGIRINIPSPEGESAIEQAALVILSEEGRVLARFGFPVYISGA